MPIYEYECRKCKAHQEVMQKISDKPLTKCAKCGGQLEKQWSNTSFQLKGSGWYVTDYAGKKAEKTSESSADESKQSADASEKSDGKKTDAANEPAAKNAKDSNADGKEKPAAKKTNSSKSSNTKSNVMGGSSATGD
jgi:putative FmdB family regulatory protein